MLNVRQAFNLLKNKAKILCFARANLKSYNGICFQSRNASFFRLPPNSNTSFYKAKDNIPEHYELIYRNTMHRYFLMAQIVSAVSVVAISIAYIWQSEIQKPNLDHWKNKPKTFETDMYMMTIGLILINVALQVILHRCPIRIYNNAPTNKYIMVFYDYLPFMKSRLSCQVSDIKKLKETGILPWSDSRYEILSARKVIMLENFFRRPADLNIMLGYQKHSEYD